MSARPTRTGLATAGLAGLLLASCGAAGEPSHRAGAAAGSYRVAVAHASFPAAQRLAQPVHLVLAIRNSGDRPLPDVAVTICNITCAYPPPAGGGTQAAAFASDIAPLPSLANPSRPIWIITRPPGPSGFGSAGGAQGGAATAYSNTWTLGRLAPGDTATFDWSLAAVRAGRHTVAWQVAPSLSGSVLARGRFAVRVLT
ncbi:MAG: hypothetical protein ACYCXW_23075, partial [Solirubrobacteraceae bacterium]